MLQKYKICFYDYILIYCLFEFLFIQDTEWKQKKLEVMSKSLKVLKASFYSNMCACLPRPLKIHIPFSMFRARLAF